jgi:hypothetical protein
MIVKIAGATVDYQYNSIEIDDALGERSTASFTIIDKVGNLSYQKGQQVQIFENDGITLAFGGVIDKPVTQYLSLANNSKVHQIQCVDYLYISDKKIIAKVYQNMLAGAIVKDIITNYLAADGITQGTIQDGPIVTEAVFNYINTTRAFERLAEIAGFEFNIDRNKQLQFFHRATNYNNTVINETSAIKNVQVEPVAEDYRNKQYIKAGMDTTSPQTKSFKGDGTNKTFTLDYPVAKVPTISVNGVSKTVGIKGVDTGKDWYWNKGENVISQDDAATALTTVQTLTVTYQGLFNIVAVTYDQAEIIRMQALDGTTGIYENVSDDPYITSRQPAFDDANAKLKRYAKVGRRITFDTYINDLDVGQLVQVTLPSFGINDYYLVEKSRASELGTIDGRLMYSVSIVDGSATGGWANFFKKLANKGEAYVLRENIQENEVLATLSTFSKTWSLVDMTGNIFKKTYPSSSLYPGSNVYPSFEDSDRVKFLVFYDASNNEIFRKAITLQSVTSNNKQITSTTYIAPYEANVSIAYVGWIGGATASISAGSGVLVDKQTFSKVKSNLESIQIDKIDTQGW